MLVYLKSCIYGILQTTYIHKVFKSNAYEKSRLEANNIIRLMHSIEKGLSLGNIRSGFGYEKIIKLIGFINSYYEKGYDMNSSAVLMGADAIRSYLKYHEDIGFSNDKIVDIANRFKSLDEIIKNDNISYGGTKLVKKSDFNFDIEQIENFINTRHSIRDFSKETVDLETLKKAIGLALRCPTACNRQAVRVHIIQKKSFDVVQDWLKGTGGFAEVMDVCLVITAKVSAYSLTERYQYIVSPSIFAGYLSLTLHAYGMGACLIQRPVITTKTWRAVSKKLNIPKDEQVICMVAVGMLNDEFKVPVSGRLNLDEIVSIVNE